MPRGRYRLLDLLAPSRGRVIARLAGDLGGARFEADLGDALSREVCFTGIYEPPIARVFQRHVPRGGTVVDAGANWGYFTLIAAAAAGGAGRVIALEPDPRHFAALERNLSLNGFTQVRAMRAAAASGDGTLMFAGYDDGEANRGVSRLVPRADAAAANQFAVRATTVDAVTGTASTVDLVKIDVEGAEDLVLQGMQAGLASRRYRAVLLELHPSLLRERGVDPESCLRRLQQAGYRGWSIDPSPAAYRAAIDPAVPVESLLRPLDDWRRSPWPHLLWLC
ncbi:MAG TPA: FkbM family methyltransferase [Vicinamibacterales bacterium]|nr:FkbM family methyltransferase [Vicinamibacterales bacterium]